MVAKYAAVAAALAGFASAQTFTDCNPMNTTCPNDPALGKSIDLKAFSGKPSEFSEQSNGISYKNGQAQFAISKHGDAPTLISDFYIFWGSVSVVMQASPGTGIVSSVVLESDDLDEIDWEWLGGNTAQVETNYFGKGDTTTYNRATYVNVGTPQNTFHNYTVNWSQEQTEWIIDGNVVRTLKFGDANGGNNYPQTPMKVKIGSWAGGDPGNPKGTIEWAGGKTNYADGPFTMLVKEISVVDGTTGSAYQYTDKSGSYKSIKALKGDKAKASASGVSIGSASATNTGKPTGSAAATASSAKTTVAKASKAEATGAGATGSSTGSSPAATASTGAAAAFAATSGFTVLGALAAAFAFAL